MKNKLKAIILIILICSCAFLAACNSLSAPISDGAINNENNLGALPSEEIIEDDEFFDAPDGSNESPEENDALTTDEITPDEKDATQNDDTTPQTEIYQKYILVKTNGLNVRSGAGTQYSSICSFNNGDMLGYLGVENGWYVTTARGVKCYVSADTKYTALVSLKKGSDNVEKVIAVALKYLGTPYVYGAVRYINGNGVRLSGFTTNAFDCSSFMQYAFYVGNGDKLGMTTRDQVLQGSKVAKSDIRRGDLLFFTNASRYYNTGLERVGHVALYLGDNYILHTASDYAVIEQISSTRWSYYIEARRIAA